MISSPLIRIFKRRSNDASSDGIDTILGNEAGKCNEMLLRPDFERNRHVGMRIHRLHEFFRDGESAKKAKPKASNGPHSQIEGTQA